MDEAQMLSQPQLLPELSILSFLAIFGIVTALVWQVVTYFRSPLRQYPGPFLAGWTNLWRLYYTQTGQFALYIHELHKKYGPVVRLGPDLLDIDMPELVQTIYDNQGRFAKTPFYHASSVKNEGKIIYNMFSETDPKLHARQRKPIARYYSPEGLKGMEPHLNKMLTTLCHELEMRYIQDSADGSSSVFDLGHWLTYYTWDVVGQTTFSEPIGFLQHGSDFDGTIHIAEQSVEYFSFVSSMPFLDHWLDKNPIHRLGPPSFGRITNEFIKNLIDRASGATTTNIPDFLDKYLEAQKLHPDVVDNQRIIGYLMNNLIAGADTTAITLKSAFYHSLKNPSIWSRLENEVLQSIPANTTSENPVPYTTTLQMPYLHAVIREAMRLDHVIGLTLERYVPPTGLHLNLPTQSSYFSSSSSFSSTTTPTSTTPTFIPPSTSIGLNPYVIARNTSFWGADASTFRPERWLRNTDSSPPETAEEFAVRYKRMSSGDLGFGYGTRQCVGKHLATMELYKVFATLVGLFEIELVVEEEGQEEDKEDKEDGEGEAKEKRKGKGKGKKGEREVRFFFFIMLEGLRVRIRKRGGGRGRG